MDEARIVEKVEAKALGGKLVSFEQGRFVIGHGQWYFVCLFGYSVVVVAFAISVVCWLDNNSNEPLR